MNGKPYKEKKVKTNYRFVGKLGSAKQIDGKFKAADTMVPIFITRVHKETSEKDIEEYVRNKTQENIVLEKITTKKEMDYNAYKFFVSKQKMFMFLDTSLWPEGVIFRQFVNFKHKNITLNRNGLYSKQLNG